MGAPLVSVAVPVKDRRERMLRCLDALLAQDHPNYEILVIDNESTDGTAEACRAHAEGSGVPVRVEVLPGTVGAIRNRAARLARGELMAYTDSDCMPEPGWLSAGVAPFEGRPELGIVCGRTLPAEPIVQGWPATIEVEELTGRFESCNVLFRREAFCRTAGFDERIGHFWEDTAAGFAIKRLGWEVAYVPEALVYHDVTYPGFWWHIKRMQKNRNLAPVLAKYPEIRREALFMRLFLQERDARFVAAVAGLLLARRRPVAALLLALPYAVMVARQQDGGEFDPRAYAQAPIYDLARVTGLLRGGLRNGRIVL